MRLRSVLKVKAIRQDLHWPPKSIPLMLSWTPTTVDLSLTTNEHLLASFALLSWKTREPYPTVELDFYPVHSHNGLERHPEPGQQPDAVRPQVRCQEGSEWCVQSVNGMLV